MIRSVLLATVLTVCCSSAAAAQVPDPVATPTPAPAPVEMSRVASSYSFGWGAVKGAGDAVAGATIEHESPFLLAGQLEIALANRVDAVLGGGLLRATPLTTSGSAAPTPGDRWTVPFVVTGVRYALTEGNMIDVGVTPLLAMAGRSTATFQRGPGLDPTRLTTSGGLGGGIEGDLRFPGGRCKGVISAQLSVRYMAWRWPVGNGARLDVRPLTVAVGVVIRH